MTRHAAPVRLDRSLRRPLRRGPMARLRLRPPGDRARPPSSSRTRRRRSPASPRSCRPTWTPCACTTRTCRCSCRSAGAPDALRAARLPARRRRRGPRSASARARRDWAEDGDRSSFALSAITGSGKTVIATAVIEALLFGSTDLDTEPIRGVAFLWITDDPALNRQTRARMLDASELLTPWSLREVDESFPDADLAPGRVYFLNTQKLSKYEPARPERHERPRVLVLGHPPQHDPGRPDRPRPGPRRGASRHEARGRPPDDRSAAHPAASPARTRRCRSSGASRPRSTASPGRWARSPTGPAARTSSSTSSACARPASSRTRSVSTSPTRRARSRRRCCARRSRATRLVRGALGGLLGRRGRAGGAAGARRPGAGQGHRRQADRARRRRSTRSGRAWAHERSPTCSASTRR